ncbi:hypothetical protein D7X33_21010 [Butyricicoccus sp. 1XD8-22]|nr:hypothetical protein D7X33_21010 [Butyricicoccus sp. 1XD8-22]
MKKIEFSKMIVISVSVFMLSIVGISFYLMFQLGDLSALTEIIIGSFALGSLTFSYYFWKSKNENLVKIMNQLPPEQQEVIRDELENEFMDNVNQDEFRNNI